MKLRAVMEPGAGYVPGYAHEGDAGMDLKSTEDLHIPPDQSRLVRTGLHVEIPEGYVGLQFPRSGLGTKGITLRNAVGVIDSGYRGEVLANVWNTSPQSFHVSKGDRVCQLVVVPCARCEVETVGELAESERGEDGHGSTGVA